MKKYMLKINTPGRIVAIKGRAVRTPTECIIDQSEIKILESRVKSAGITDYSINKVNSKKLTIKISEPIIEEPEITYKKEIKHKTEALSTLDKIMNDV
jgi:hypothetical protein